MACGVAAITYGQQRFGEMLSPRLFPERWGGSAREPQDGLECLKIR